MSTKLSISVKKKLLVSCILIFLSFAWSISLWRFGAIEFFEMKVFDQKMQYSSQQIRANEGIAVVLVDDASLSAMSSSIGRWPWPRAIWSEVIQYLREHGARKIVFDILFSEYQKPKDTEGALDHDDLQLVTASAGANDVVHAMQIIHDTEDEINNSLLNRDLPAWTKENLALKKIESSYFGEEENNNFYLPFDELAQNIADVGVVEFSPDRDGVYRRVRLIRNYKQHWFPTLAIAPLLSKEDFISVKDRELAFANYKIPLDEEGRFLINMKKTFNLYSISGVLADIQQKKNSFLNGSEFQNKIVFLAVSAVGGNDLKNTAIGPKTPGVLLHASILSNILDSDYFKKIEFTYLVLFTIVMTVFSSLSVLFAGNIIIQLLPFVLFSSSYSFISFALFNSKRLDIPLVFPLITLLFTTVSSYVYLAFTEGRDKKKVRKMLSQYVSPVVLKEVMDKGDALTAGVGSKENMTILFSDVRSFTTFSEKQAPEVVVEMLNYYLNEMVDVVFKYEGTIDKFVGDAVMAFWGAPIRSSDHALKATRAAIEMLERLEKINEHFKSQNRAPFAIGIGLNTGEVILGNIGSEKKLDYTVIGDNVNLASRMEGLTKEYHSQFLISESTYQLVKDFVPAKILDFVKVKGKNKPIAIYAPLFSYENKDLPSLYRKAFDFYLSQNFVQAILVYNELLELEKGRPHYDYVVDMIERCEEFSKSPPSSDWDGSYTMKTK